MIGAALLIISAIVVSIWVFWEFKRFRSKIYAIFLICLVLFVYITATVSLKGQNVDFKSVSGVVKAAQIYFSFLGSIFGNFKSITTNAVKMDWSANRSIG